MNGTCEQVSIEGPLPVTKISLITQKEKMLRPKGSRKKEKTKGKKKQRSTVGQKRQTKGHAKANYKNKGKLRQRSMDGTTSNAPTNQPRSTP